MIRELQLLLAQTAGWPQYVTWIIAGIALVTGGLGGAVLTASIALYRNRLQPIAFRIEEQFSSETIPTGSSPLRATITLTHTGKSSYYCENLRVSQVDLINRGNKDYAQFAVGLGLETGAALHVAEETKDRHHKVTYSERPDPPDRTLTHIDCILTPFNRGDIYSIRVFIEMVPEQNGDAKVVLSTPEVGVRLVRIPTLSQLAQIAIDRPPILSLRSMLWLIERMQQLR